QRDLRITLRFQVRDHTLRVTHSYRYFEVS
ncbi:MAG: hypothetical protein K0Q61_634, partial [Rhodococcus erythropolis]|nr:hypothetical protein [Rhodococcus erythropolis]